MSTLNSRGGWGGSFTSGTDEPMSRSGGASGQNKRSGAAVWRPDQATNVSALKVLCNVLVLTFFDSTVKRRSRSLRQPL